MTAVLLTTTDNPYDVVNDYQNWFQYDVQAGYNTCELIARLTDNSDDLSEEEEASNIETVIDQIINTFAGVIPYKKVVVQASIT